VRQQQGPAFVAGLAKKRLSSCHGFGIMRMASLKEYVHAFEESGRRKNAPRGFQESA
jgi:hypothetical protein